MQTMTQLSIFILLLLANIVGIYYGGIGVSMAEIEKEKEGGDIESEMNGMLAWPLWQA